MSENPITVLFGGPSPEHDISILTGLQCERVLQGSGATVRSIYWDRALNWHLVPAGTEARDYLDGAPARSTLLELRLDSEPGWVARKRLRSVALEVGVILNCFHGGYGENGGVQALFELMGIPATGGPTEAASLGMDKLAFKALMDSSGLPSLPRVLLREDADIPFAGPYIVKPRFGGSSIGIEIVEDREAAMGLLEVSVHLRRGAVIEPFRRDLSDMNIAFRTYPQFEVSLLERPLRSDSGEIYSYEQKYLQGSGGAFISAPRELPAQVAPETTERARQLAQEVATVTGLTGIIRIDFLSDGGELFINEVNSIPGAMALYLWPQGYTSKQLLLDMVEEIRSSRPAPTATGFSDGSALRVAGGIAAKLTGIDDTRSRGV